jgi:hypothetical protein
MNWAELALPLAGIVGLLLGCILGAKIGSVSLWKGPAIAIGAGAVQAILSELVINPLTGLSNFFLDYAIFFVVAGVIAYVLNVGGRAAAVIIIGGFLGAMTFVLAAGLLLRSMIGDAT